MSVLNNTYVDLLPYRDQVSPWSVVNTYSLNQTGVGGRFVTILTGANSPEDMAGDFAASSAGQTIAGVTNLRYEATRKVRYATHGEGRATVFGLSLHGTIETDENGQKVILHPEVQKEKEIVPSGGAIPIATEGIYRLKQNAFFSTPIPLPGYVGIISGTQGQVVFALPSNATSYINSGLAVCKAVSSTGAAFGGYIDVKLTLD